MFEKEDEETFFKRLERIEEYRAQSETFLKYNHMIETMNTPTHELSNEIRDRIMYFVLVSLCFSNKTE